MGPNESAPARPCVSARTIQTADHKELFMLVVWNPDSSLFDVTLTDANQTFVGIGLTYPERHVLKGQQWLDRAQEALCGRSTLQAHSSNANSSASSPVSYEFKFQPDTGKLSWTWQQTAQGLRMSQDVTLARAACSTPLQAMLRTLCASCHSLLASCSSLQQHHDRALREQQRLQAELERLADERQRREEQLYIKFNLVLNAKKERLRQAKEEMERLQAQYRDLQGRIEEAQALDTDDERELGQVRLDGGAASPAGRHHQDQDDGRHGSDTDSERGDAFQAPGPAHAAGDGAARDSGGGDGPSTSAQAQQWAGGRMAQPAAAWGGALAPALQQHPAPSGSLPGGGGGGLDGGGGADWTATRRGLRGTYESLQPTQMEGMEDLLQQQTQPLGPDALAALQLGALPSLAPEAVSAQELQQPMAAPGPQGVGAGFPSLGDSLAPLLAGDLEDLGLTPAAGAAPGATGRAGRRRAR